MENPEERLFEDYPANTNVEGVVIGTVIEVEDTTDRWAVAPWTFNPAMTGERLRDKGMTEAEQAAQEAWKARVRIQIWIWADSGQDFTAEEIRDVVGDPPDHGNAMGSLFNTAARHGLIEKVGYRPAKRAGSHARALAVWRGVDRG